MPFGPCHSPRARNGKLKTTNLETQKGRGPLIIWISLPQNPSQVPQKRLPSLSRDGGEMWSRLHLNAKVSN